VSTASGLNDSKRRSRNSVYGVLQRVHDRLREQNHIGPVCPARINQRWIVGGTLSKLERRHVVCAQTENQFGLGRLQTERVEVFTRVVTHKLRYASGGHLAHEIDHLRRRRACRGRFGQETGLVRWIEL
jgi:hypothetical protein